MLSTVSYCLAMGVCGVILVAIGLTLSDLAANIGLTPEGLGSVFIARGLGAVVGSLYSAQLYRDFSGNRVVASALLGLAVTCLYLPVNTTFIGIHIAFLALGLGTAITDTGVQILTRKLHGARAGPYLGLNTVAFGVSGSLMPALSFLAPDLYTRFAFLAVLILMVLCAVLLSNDPSAAAKAATAGVASNDQDILASSSKDGDEDGPTWTTSHNSEGTMMLSPRRTTSSPGGGGVMTIARTEGSKLVVGSIEAGSTASHLADPQEPPHFYTEMFISAMVFCVIGGKVTVTAYLDAYVRQEVSAIPIEEEHRLMLCFWIFVTLGRILGIYYQQTFSDATLPLHLFSAAVSGSLAGAILFFHPHSASVLWFAIPLYGLCNGPVLGYCYDLNNRLTLPTEKSMAIVMFGLNLGASIVPFLSSLVWRTMFGPTTLLAVIFLSLAVPIPFLFLALRYSYMSSVSIPRVGRPQSYESIPPTPQS